MRRCSFLIPESGSVGAGVMATSSEARGVASNSRYGTGDLRAVALPEMVKRGGEAKAIHELYSWVESFVIESINWYTREKVSKSRWSRFLRISAVLSFALGTVAPVVVVGMGWSRQAIWGYGIIGLGACCVAVDRVCGFSSSWMRYVSTAISLNRQLVMFQASWLRIEAKLVQQPSSDSFSEAVQELVRFVDVTSLLMENETLTWVSEFQNYVVQLETGSVPALPQRSQ
ncbi:SLATT domain-containing protein [Streptomyces tropicalis]|uniref:SLATT domain-containing protein n=1 Tax=Streptomyces tropicalis TaxID=3034234 RepID=UPI0034D957B7